METASGNSTERINKRDEIIPLYSYSLTYIKQLPLGFWKLASFVLVHKKYFVDVIKLMSILLTYSINLCIYTNNSFKLTITQSSYLCLVVIAAATDRHKPVLELLEFQELDVAKLSLIHAYFHSNYVKNEYI